MEVEPFSIRIDGAVLDDLRARLRNTRWPDEIEGAGWDYGTNRDYLRELCAYWCEVFDWRAQEARLNALPHYLADVDGARIHFIHIRGEEPDSPALLLTHGWPGSFYEFTKLIPLLVAAPGSFDIVVPSLPGYGFSPAPERRFASASVPELWVALMQGLGYERFGAHGGDIGGGITARLGQRHPDMLIGIHVTNVYGSIEPDDPPPTPAERDFLARRKTWDRDEWAYGEIQGTRPQSLAYGLTDSPAGLAGWLIEKYRAWSDCGGELERCFTKDELLTTLTLYWATGTIGSSFRPYWDFRHNPNPAPWTRIEVPSAVAVFPRDLETPPLEFARRSYNVAHWTEMPRGGHFAAFEQPELLAADIQRFFAGLSP